MSVSSPLGRRVPQQLRGERRVAGLLKAAALVIDDSGYESATMCAIAQRAGASIGSLYQFFPNKEAIASALLAQYRQELEMLWASLEQSKTVAADALATQLIGEEIAFLENHPAFRQLLSLPTAGHDPSIREILRQRLARILRACAPHLSRSQAHLYATVALQFLRGLNELYTEASGRPARKHLVREFEVALSCYLQTQLLPTTSLAPNKPASKH